VMQKCRPIRFIIATSANSFSDGGPTIRRPPKAQQPLDPFADERQLEGLSELCLAVESLENSSFVWI
jgi:hypothetical protein